ncbi:hypothetical protein [Streptomyces lydicus]|uniref:hypothetical protein n=1 Tax=Streptomyces lydicus TaxID=47763 RepID=UPI0036E1D19D
MTKILGQSSPHDIAEATGLSAAASRYALRGLQGVPPEAHRWVHEAAHRLGHQEDPTALALTSDRTGHVSALGGSLAAVRQQDTAAALGQRCSPTADR